MTHNVNKETHTIYKDISKDLYVAIENKHVPAIQKIVREFKRVEEVPEKNEIPGVYLQNMGNGTYHKVDDQKQSIKIRNLRF
jgi:hypothetical protein